MLYQCRSLGANQTTSQEFLEWFVFALRPTRTRHHDQGLSERVRMPSGADVTAYPERGKANSGSMQTVPVNQSAGLCWDACVARTG